MIKRYLRLNLWVSQFSIIETWMNWNQISKFALLIESFIGHREPWEFRAGFESLHRSLRWPFYEFFLSIFPFNSEFHKGIGFVIRFPNQML
jgi:hypothetical protein